MTDQHLLSAGTAKIDITPQYDVSLAGYVLREGKSTGVLHHIFARALYLEQGESSALIIVCELLGFDKEYVAKVRSKIREKTGNQKLDIMIACTHTHSGPATQGLREAGEIELAYLDWLEERLTEVAHQSTQSVSPVTVHIGRTQLTGVSENRREEGGPIDPELIVMSLENMSGDRVATIMNYTCHPTALQHTNMQVSGNFPGYTMQLVEQSTNTTAFYLNGATGNIRPIRRNTLEAMQYTAEQIAEAVQKTLNNLEPIMDPQLTSVSESLELFYDKVPTESDIINTTFRKDQPPFYMPERSSLLDEKQDRIIKGWRETMLSRLRNGQLFKTVPVEVQVICLGPVSLVGIGGELFVELGFKIKENAASEYVIISCYTNDNIGYIPSPEAYQHGGYEVNESFILYNNPAKLDQTAGEKIVESAIYLVQKSKEKAH